MTIAYARTDPARQLRVRLSDRFSWGDRKTITYTRRIGSTGDNRIGFGQRGASVMLILTESWFCHNAINRKSSWLPGLAEEQGSPRMHMVLDAMGGQKDSCLPPPSHTPPRTSVPPSSRLV